MPSLFTKVGLFRLDRRSDKVKDGAGLLSLADRVSVIQDMRDGGEMIKDGGVERVSAMVVILEASDRSRLSKVPVAVGIRGVARVAAMGHGSKALRVGTTEGKGYAITVVFPCKRTGLKVLPEGDHMKAIFMP